MSNVAVLFLGSRNAGPGFSFSLAKELEERGVLSSVCISAGNTMGPIFKEKLRTPIFEISRCDNISRIISPFSFLIALSGILKEIKSRKVNIILCPMLHPWLLLMIPFLKLRCKIAFVVHDAKPHDGDRFNLIFFINKWLSFTCDHFIFLSKIQRDFFIQHMPGGYDTKIIQHPSFRHIIPPTSAKKRYDFLFFGRIERYKGLELLLIAFEKLILNKPGATLLIAGKIIGGQDVKFNDCLGLTIRTEYIPENELPDLISSARYVVLPYTEATQSGVMTLASDMGVPCLATPIAGLIEQAAYTGNVRFADAVAADSLSLIMEDALDGRPETVIGNTIYSGITEALAF